MPRDLSVVIPLYNEVANLRPLWEELTATLSATTWDYELIFIDDGSTDGSFGLLRELQAVDERLVGVRLRRNFGQTAAFAAGFDRACGRLIVTMDADRQNDARDVPALLAKLSEGYDVVNGWRQNRQDAWLWRKLPSQLANRLIAFSTGVQLRDRGCSLRAFRAEVVKELRLYGEMHRFIPELIHSAGFRMAEVAVTHRPRVAGKSKYGLSRTFRVLLDLVTVLFLRHYGDRPMHLFGGLGMVAGGTGFLLGLWLSLAKIVAGIAGGMAGFNAYRLSERPLLLLAVLLMILGVQFLSIGLLGELLVRIYYESQNKPVYYVQEVIEKRPAV